MKKEHYKKKKIVTPLMLHSAQQETMAKQHWFSLFLTLNLVLTLIQASSQSASTAWTAPILTRKHKAVNAVLWFISPIICLLFHTTNPRVHTLLWKLEGRLRPRLGAAEAGSRLRKRQKLTLDVKLNAIPVTLLAISRCPRETGRVICSSWLRLQLKSISEESFYH